MKRMPICEIRLSTGNSVPIDFDRFDEDMNYLAGALLEEIFLPSIKKSGFENAVKVLQDEIVNSCMKLSGKAKTSLLSTIIWHLVCEKYNKTTKSNKKIENHLLILRLGGAEKTCIMVRDKVFGGSWKKMLDHIQKKGSVEQRKQDAPMIKRLMAYEKKYGVNLRDMMEKGK